MALKDEDLPEEGERPFFPGRKKAFLTEFNYQIIFLPFGKEIEYSPSPKYHFSPVHVILSYSCSFLLLSQESHPAASAAASAASKSIKEIKLSKFVIDLAELRKAREKDGKKPAGSGSEYPLSKNHLKLLKKKR